MTKRLTIVQYAGDFREASERLRAGGHETYRAQKFTVDYVEGLAAKLEQVTTITAFTKEKYDVVLPSGARAIGAGFDRKVDTRALLRLVELTAPDMLILRSPFRPIMRWAVKRKCRTLALFADSFNGMSLKQRAIRWLLKRRLNSPSFDIVANHGVRSSRQLIQLGIRAEKIIPWDFPALNTPHELPPKSKAKSSKVIYVGSLIEAKGVGDLLVASRHLRDRGVSITLELVGNNLSPNLKDLVERSEYRDFVILRGNMPNGLVISAMRQADVVVVPSRHEYSEGMPLTIYEAFCSRTPLIVSDHPMFTENITHGESGLVFRAGDAAALASQMIRLFEDDHLYAALSANSLRAWERLQSATVPWDQLIDHWIDNTPESQRWLKDRSSSFSKNYSA